MYRQDQLREIRAAIAAAEARAGRAAGSVSLLAVSKTFPAEDVQQAYDDGQRLFGENRLQEAMEKKEQLEARLEEKMDRWVYLNELAEKIQNQE